MIAERGKEGEEVEVEVEVEVIWGGKGLDNDWLMGNPLLSSCRRI